jgi:predicted metal-dependent peptidase
MGVNKEAETKIIRARISLLKVQPFFGTLALRLNMIEDTTLNPPTMGVDGTNIFYHPDFVMEHSFDEVKFVIAHEVMHCVFDHVTRVGGRDPVRWNVAGDYAINPLLVDAGLQLPSSGGLINAAYAGMTADQIYNLLPQSTKPYDSFRPAPKTPAKMRELEEDWKVATVQAANAAKGVGNLPASLKRFVHELIESKTDWRAQLREFAVEISKNDYAWQRVNRRFVAAGFYLPGLYSENMGTMVIVTDDSGSISNDILQLFASEIEAIREAVRPERTIVLSCDMRINHIDDLTMDDPFQLKCHGGGGTDFRPPFEWLKEQDITPSCLIYLTDLDGPFPEIPPHYPVMWCSINKQRAPWGQTLHITKD